MKSNKKKILLYTVLGAIVVSGAAYLVGGAIYDNASLTNYTSNKNYLSTLSDEVPYTNFGVKIQKEGDSKIVFSDAWVSEESARANICGIGDSDNIYVWKEGVVFKNDQAILTCEKDEFARRVLSVNVDFSFPHTMEVNEKPVFTFQGDAVSISSELDESVLFITDPLIQLGFSRGRERDRLIKGGHCSVTIQGKIDGENYSVSIAKFTL